MELDRSFTFNLNSYQLKVTAQQALLAVVLLAATELVRWWLAAAAESAIDYDVPEPAQCAAGWAGETLAKPSMKTSDPTVIQCYAPATGQLLGLVPAASIADIDQTIAKAKSAQVEWARTSFAQRRKVLQTLLRFVLKNQDSLAASACLDSGKTRIDASFGEILVTVEKLKWTLLHGEKALKAERRPTNFLMSYKVNEVRWEPLGVVAALVSWNYPFHNVIGPIISAIFAGNGIVVKASENTAWSAVYYLQIVKEALRVCGHNPDLVQSVACWPDVAPHLTSHHDISQVTFIGSRKVAHHVAEATSKNLIPLCCELGGKDASIILDDVSDIKKVASILMRGVFQSSGQNCIGIERIVATPKSYDKLVAILEPRIKSIRQGSGLNDEAKGVDMGAMISDANFSFLTSLIDDAVKKGARCLVGGKPFKHPVYTNGHYFQPTLVVDVTPEMDLAQQETFAPICVLMRAEDVDDAIRIANSNEYGLGSSVFGRNKADLNKIVSSLQTGMVAVNDFAVFYAVQLPFGGVKGSGYGRMAGAEGLRSVSNTKSVCADRFPSIIGTAIPGPLDYPIKSAAAGWDMCKGIIHLGYGDTLARRVEGIWKLIKNSLA